MLLSRAIPRRPFPATRINDQIVISRVLAQIEGLTHVEKVNRKGEQKERHSNAQLNGTNSTARCKMRWQDAAAAALSWIEFSLPEAHLPACKAGNDVRPRRWIPVQTAKMRD